QKGSGRGSRRRGRALQIQDRLARHQRSQDVGAGIALMIARRPVPRHRFVLPTRSLLGPMIDSPHIQADGHFTLWQRGVGRLYLVASAGELRRIELLALTPAPEPAAALADDQMSPSQD